MATAVISGASGGIGSAVARELAAHGVRLALLGRDRGRLERLADEVGGALVCPGDLGDGDDVARTADTIRSAFDRLDILVHSASIEAAAPIAEASADAFDALYRANLRGPFDLTRTLLPQLVAAPGHVFVMNSSQGLAARGGVSQYAATQHARRALADSLRHEVNEHGVRVTSLFLGRTATPMQERVHRREGRPYRPEALIQAADVARLVHAIWTMPPCTEVTDVNVRPTRKPS